MEWRRIDRPVRSLESVRFELTGRELDAWALFEPEIARLPELDTKHQVEALRSMLTGLRWIESFAIAAKFLAFLQYMIGVVLDALRAIGWVPVVAPVQQAQPPRFQPRTRRVHNEQPPPPPPLAASPAAPRAPSLAIAGGHAA